MRSDRKYGLRDHETQGACVLTISKSHSFCKVKIRFELPQFPLFKTGIWSCTSLFDRGQNRNWVFRLKKANSHFSSKTCTPAIPATLLAVQAKIQSLACLFMLLHFDA
jgi:hypothetical protein